MEQPFIQAFGAQLCQLCQLYISPKKKRSENALKLSTIRPQTIRVLGTGASCRVVQVPSLGPGSRDAVNPQNHDTLYPSPPTNGKPLFPVGKMIAADRTWVYMTGQVYANYGCLVLNPPVFVGPKSTISSATTYQYLHDRSSLLCIPGFFSRLLLDFVR